MRVVPTALPKTPLCRGFRISGGPDFTVPVASRFLRRPDLGTWQRGLSCKIVLVSGPRGLELIPSAGDSNRTTILQDSFSALGCLFQHPKNQEGPSMPPPE